MGDRTYRRVVISKHGGPGVLQMIDDVLVPPGPEEVRIRVEAAGVANPDVLMREGVYPGAPRPPYTPGYDVTGTMAVVVGCGPVCPPAAARLHPTPSVWAR